MMLARAAERKLRRDAFRPNSRSSLPSEQFISWLTPAQTRRAATVAAPSPITTNSHDTRKQRSTPLSFTSRSESRSLATAADSQFASPASSFGGFMPPWKPRPQAPHVAKLDNWNPSQTLILRDPGIQHTTPIKFGIGGDTAELYQNLHACLRVGLLDRATAILDRLVKMCNPSSPEVVEAHNMFLQHLLEKAEQNPTPDAMREMEEWYDQRMVRNAIEPSPDTLVILLRGALNFLDGYALQAALAKYFMVAEECSPDAIDVINNSDEFSDDEWDRLIRFQYSKYKSPPPPSESQQAPISTPLGYEKLIEHGFVSNPAHQVNSVEQKGYGLETLKNSLAMFDATKDAVPYPHEMEGSQEEKDRAYAFARQLRIETDALEAAIKRWKAEDEKLQGIGIHGVLKSKPIQALLWQWYSALLPLIKREMAQTKELLANPSPANQRDDRHIYGTYLDNVKAEKVAALTVSRVIQSCARGAHADTDTLKLSALTQAVGDDIEQEYQFESQSRYKAQVKKQRRLARTGMLEKLRLSPESAPDKATAPTSNANLIAPLELAKYSRDQFPLIAKTKIGAMALELMLKTATITVTAEDPKTGKQLTSTQPAFHHHMSFVLGKKIGFLAPHAEVLEKLQRESLHNISTRGLPMVFEPKPWSSFDDGGFYATKSTVIRTKSGDSSQRAYAHTAIANGDMDKVLAGLDVLGKVPWQINEKVFEVMVQAWNSEQAIGGLVAANMIGDRPVEPSPDAPKEEYNSWVKRLRDWENRKSGIHSQRCFQNFQLEIARAYLKEKQMFFPHSVDFRGRAYPVPPLLNHIGADLARSLLKFANGKELGAVGLQWIKVQLANLYGFDKASLREREQFAMDNIGEIYDSATNPLTGRRWWVKAEDPWQCLACCMELKNALDSPDPTRYVSQLPVHQDGTCNGLQHYAALGGDHAGASQVNLEPSDRPQDIYTGVAELVKDMVREDAARGIPEAVLVKDKITRKVVKRTVMTNVYGVTFIGAKAQVLEELKDAFPDFAGTPEFPALHKPALYIAKKIFAALGKIFNGAQEIQYWLNECGERITTSLSPEQIQGIKDRFASNRDPKSKSSLQGKALKKVEKDHEAFKTSIIWTTPLKMPVVQPYRKDGVETIATRLQTVAVSKHSSFGSVNKRKQLQAFPPNFIHSLDATHMLLSALKCNEMGLDFAAVHDSFWTHAADIPNLNIILRDAFVRMHSEDVMGRLAAEFKARYAGHLHKADIRISSKVAKMIIAWRREHRKLEIGTKAYTQIKDAPTEEVALEAQRQELLHSEDPSLRQQGEEMVTPTSIWIAHQDPKALVSSRLALLGETKQGGTTEYDKIKDKILSTEAEAVETKLNNSDLKSADSTPGSIVAAAIEAEAENLNVDEIDAQKEASLAGTTEASIQSVKDTILPEPTDEDTTALDEDDAQETEEQLEVEGGQKGNGSTPKQARLSTYTMLNVWVPLSFPPVPKKGTWDVSRLHKSKYFFS
ncbi:unnamed protein product [Periconia digitata]|uniref:DNA-directed RNA polymerase n=1 Tax=Periconia digitata TaxID=1303443 RepID=A0A9W4UWA1_9PLEO|nr:unnamed protein product [Periconia digitata]